MASKQQSLLYYRQAMTQAGKGGLYPVCFIFGEEDYLIDNLISEIAKKHLPEIEKEINYFVRYASETPLEEIVTLMAGGSLFGSRKLIIYRDFQNSRNPNLKILDKFLSQPDPEIMLVVVAHAETTSQSKLQTLRKKVATVNVRPLNEQELDQFVRDEFKRYQKNVSADGIKAIVYLVGEKIHDLKTEILQVANFFKNQTDISADDVEKVVGIHVTQNVFELTGMIAGKNLEKSLFILRNLLEKGESPATILALLLRHVLILLKMRGYYLSGEKNERTIQDKLRLYPRHFKEYKAQLSRWKFNHLKEAIRLLRESDEIMKSSQVSPQVMLDMLIVKLINLN